MELTREHIEAVSKLSSEERYSYTIKRIADWEVMYTLSNAQDEIVWSELEGNLMVPFWTAPEFAEKCISSGWGNTQVKMITLDDFEQEIVDFLAEREYLLNIFPVGDKTGFVVDLLEFSRDLAAELENYS